MQTSYYGSVKTLSPSILISIICHLALVYVTVQMSPEMSQPGIINLTVIDRQAFENSTDDDKTPAKHHGLRRIRVKKESQSKRKPMLFPSIAQPTLPPIEPTPKNKDGDGQKLQSQSEAQPLKWIPLLERTLHPQDEELRVGNFSAVNMDSHLYFSFFNRMYNQVYPDWHSSVQRLIFKELTITEQIRDLVNRKRITEIEFWLLPNGKFHSAHVMRASGLQHLDDRHVDAFIKAGIFPNPPRGLLADDGFIKFRVVFDIEVKPEAVAKSQDSDDIR